jgi:hypothetical protein
MRAEEIATCLVQIPEGEEAAGDVLAAPVSYQSAQSHHQGTLTVRLQHANSCYLGGFAGWPGETARRSRGRGWAEFGSSAGDNECSLSCLPDLSWQFRGEKVDFLDRGRSRQQLVGLGHKRRGDGAAEMGLPAGLVGEGVKDAERARAELKREPHGC